METEKNTPQRRRKRAPVQKQEPRPREEIQYTQPKPFFRKKLLVQLLTLAAVVLAVAIGVSVFFQVDTIQVTGASKYSAQTVAQASGIETGDSLLFFGRGGAASRIKAALPYISSVRFEVKLPGTVNIIIEERAVVYGVEASDGTWWKIGADGIVIEQAGSDKDTIPTVTGVQLSQPTPGKKAQAAEQPLEGETYTTTQQERLDAALKILSQLEKWELFEKVTNVDVTDLFGLRLSCVGNYRIELGDVSDMTKKIGIVKSALEELADYGGGVLKLFYEDEKWQVQCNPWS